MPIHSTYTDCELLEAIRNDDEKAFSELFKRYWRKVHAMAYSKMRSKEVAEEIVQDMFTTLWDKRASHAINHLPSYLYTAVKHKVLNHIESHGVHQKYWDYYKRYIPKQENVTDIIVEFDDLMMAVNNGLDHMPEKSRKVFKLNRLEGHSIHEIAAILNLSEKTIQYHLTQSLKKLRVHLKEFILASCIFLSDLQH